MLALRKRRKKKKPKKKKAIPATISITELYNVLQHPLASDNYILFDIRDNKVIKYDECHIATAIHFDIAEYMATQSQSTEEMPSFKHLSIDRKHIIIYHDFESSDNSSVNENTNNTNNANTDQKSADSETQSPQAQAQAQAQAQTQTEDSRVLRMKQICCNSPNNNSGLRLQVLSETFDAFRNKYPFFCYQTTTALAKTTTTAHNTNDANDANDASDANDATHAQAQAQAWEIPVQTESAHETGAELALEIIPFTYPNEMVNNQVYLGDRSHAMNGKVFTDLQITHVVNITRLIPNEFENIGVKYLKIAIIDADEPIDEYFEKTNAFISDALLLKENRVLIHCQMGVSRSGTICIAYLMWKYRYPFEFAWEFARHRRWCVCPNDIFKQMLRKYQQSLQIKPQES